MHGVAITHEGGHQEEHAQFNWHSSTALKTRRRLTAAADSDFVRDTVTGFPHPPGDTGAATKAPLGGEEDEEVLDLDNVGEDGDMKDGEPDSADGTVASGGRGGG